MRFSGNFGGVNVEKCLKIIGKVLSITLIVAVVLLTFLMVGIRVVGFTPYTVLSGSMEPTYHVGSLVYVKKVDPAALKVGDPVTFHLTGNVIATHRIIEVHGAGTANLGFRTQGDANEQADGITPAAAIIGKVSFSIPYLGYLSNFLQRPAGVICVIGTSAAVLIISNAIDAIFEHYKKAQPESGKEEKNG